MDHDVIPRGSGTQPCVKKGGLCRHANRQDFSPRRNEEGANGLLNAERTQGANPPSDRNNNTALRSNWQPAK
jgi:hypothetical protein